MGSVNKATVTWSFETDVMCQRSACETLRYTLLATVERQTAINLDSNGLSMEAEIFVEFWTVFYLGTFSLTRTIPQFTKVWAGTQTNAKDGPILHEQQQGSLLLVRGGAQCG